VTIHPAQYAYAIAPYGLGLKTIPIAEIEVSAAIDKRISHWYGAREKNPRQFRGSHQLLVALIEFRAFVERRVYGAPRFTPMDASQAGA
jgi:hypothetical protein